MGAVLRQDRARRVHSPLHACFHGKTQRKLGTSQLEVSGLHGVPQTHFFRSRSGIPLTKRICEKHLKPCLVSLDRRQLLSFWQTLKTIISSPQRKSQMELLGTGSLSRYHCFVKARLVLAVIFSKQLNSLGNLQFRRIPEIISCGSDLDWNQIQKAPSNFCRTVNLPLEPDLTGNLKRGKPLIGAYTELMKIQAVSLKIVWGSALEIVVPN